jgi:hypothetical protein
MVVDHGLSETGCLSWKQEKNSTRQVVDSANLPNRLVGVSSMGVSARR